MKKMERATAEALLMLDHGTALPSEAMYMCKSVDDGRFYYGGELPDEGGEEFLLENTYEIGD